MLVHVIADYGSGDLAFAEVRQRLAAVMPDAEVFVTPVPGFDTVSAGFCAAQLALNAAATDCAVYMNVAPRADQLDPRPGNHVVVGGAVVVGVNSQYSFSFLRDEAEDLRHVAVPDAGSQFRSRDLFPAAFAELARGERGRLGEPVDLALLPAPPAGAVAYVDGYGNLKTTWSERRRRSATASRCRSAGSTTTATVSDGTFAVRHGEMSFAPGSSGWPSRHGGHAWFYELLLRGGSAAERLGRPRAGAPVEVRPA